MAQPPEGPGGGPSASGLDEGQIEPRDLEALRKAVVLHRLGETASPGKEAGAEAGARRRGTDVSGVVMPLSAEARRLGVLMAPPPAQRLHERALPKHCAVRRAPLPRVRIRPKNGLAVARRLSVVRQRLLPGDLLPRQLAEIFRELYFRFGKEARDFDVAAVFANIPPEAVESVKVDPGFARAAFTAPSDVPISKLSSGYSLAVLRTKTGETRILSLRL